MGSGIGERPLACIEARYLREVEPGELVTIDRAQRRTECLAPARPAGCFLEYVYLAHAASLLDGTRVELARRKMGVALAGEEPATAADVVVPIPEAALGYAAGSGITYGRGPGP